MGKLKVSWTLSVLTQRKDGKFLGPFSPVAAANLIAKNIEEPLLGVMRVHFYGDEEKLYNRPDGGKDITHHDHLIAIIPHGLIFFIDEGTEIQPVCYKIENDDPDLACGHKDTGYMMRLDETQLFALMNQAREMADQYINQIKKMLNEKAI